MNCELNAPYLDAEIRAALFQMYPTKSPGPDGMSSEFYQKHWDVVGSDVCFAVRNFLESGYLVKSVNYTHVCLIPKVQNPKRVSELRPIALCNVLYKICSKVIANRLKKHMSTIISQCQSAFIPGRLITDNSLVANEVSHFIDTDQSEGVMSLKLDMSKAYDRMEWGFLEAVLLRLGFSRHWIQLVSQCVSTVRYSFLVNGKQCGNLSPTRGLRQGDPLSPYLFLLGAEVFSALLEEKVRLRHLQGVRICEGAPVVSHLLFADDSLLFGKATVQECRAIQEVLDEYALASGQQVNFSKSDIVFSRGVSESNQLSLATILGVSIVPKHEKYLGLSTVVGRNRTETFAYIREQLSQKLEGWQGKLLSGAGRDILIRVVAQALPSYSMSCFLLPKSFCNSLQQMCAKFWWSGKKDVRKIHWMSWAKLCRPKEEGGMGFRDLYAHNLALLAKQGWRLVKNPDSLLARLYKAKYFPTCDFWNARVASNASACWKGIFEARELLVSGTRWQVGDGSRIRALVDPWLPRPRDFRPLSVRDASFSKVSDFILPNLTWNRSRLEVVFEPCDVDIILAIPLSTRSVQDKLIWHFDGKGRFTTKSAYKLACNLLYETASSSVVGNVDLWKRIWFSNVPSKVKVHIWKVCSSILPTIAALRGKRVYLDQGCVFCNADDESVEHISRDCWFIREVIKKFPELRYVFASITPGMTMADWLVSCYGSLPKEAFELLMVVIWWG